MLREREHYKIIAKEVVVKQAEKARKRKKVRTGGKK